MFPILHNVNRLINKGYYFRGSISGQPTLYIAGYIAGKYVVVLPSTYSIFQNDDGVEFKIPYSGLNLSKTTSVNLVLQSPSGRVINGVASFSSPYTLSYRVNDGDLSESGMYRYQMIFNFGTNVYHSNIGSIKVKSIIGN